MDVGLKVLVVDIIGLQCGMSGHGSGAFSRGVFVKSSVCAVRRCSSSERIKSLETVTSLARQRGCLGSLPQRQADVFVLREMDDQSTEEICQELEISPSNLWVVVYRARLQLSNCMKSRWQQESA
jgi:RNA polymerase sigma-70 factor (ECF subfamily)